LELQKRKTELSDMTFSEKLSKQDVQKRRYEELAYLFNGSSEIMKKARAGALGGGSTANNSTTPSSVSSPASMTVQ
jgi:hypothetical protein